jgi:hypothetical protein
MSEDLLDDSEPQVVVTEPDILPSGCLSDALEKKLLALWNKDPDNPPGLKELTQTLFGPDCKGTSAEGRAVRKTLAKHSIRAASTFDVKEASSPVASIELTEAHKLFITNNAKNMSSLEMARTLFNNPTLTPLNAESRVVQAFIKTLLPTVVWTPGGGGDMDVPTGPYEPPKTVNQALERVNYYINFCLNADKLSPQNKKHLSVLIGYLHTYRFQVQMNNYTSIRDRRTAEDAFVRACWDKPDLAQEEIDQYIEYSNQVVNGFTVQRRKNQLEANLEEIVTSNDESLKISMSLVESIGKASTEYHQCLARQQKLLDDLKEKRSARLSKSVKENASILNLIQMWKSEEGRKEMMAHAEKEQESMSKEVDRLSSLSDIKARILGLTKDEIRYG